MSHDIGEGRVGRLERDKIGDACLAAPVTMREDSCAAHGSGAFGRRDICGASNVPWPVADFSVLRAVWQSQRRIAFAGRRTGRVWSSWLSQETASARPFPEPDERWIAMWR
jgi:hypothetical protein